MSGKRVLLVATTVGYQIRSFGDAATRLGVRLVFASDRCDRLDDPWWDGAIPIRFHDEAQSVAAVVEACADTPPDGIVAVGDRPAVMAAKLAEALSLPGHPPQAAVVSRNKLMTREVLRAAGLHTPWFESLSLDSDVSELAQRIPYPAVVKPLALSGSRGVVRVNNVDEFRSAIDWLRNLLQTPDVRIERDEAHESALVESFIPGAEYAIEGLLTRGRFQLLAIFDKPDPLDGPFFEETIYRTPSVAPPAVQQRIVVAVMEAAAAIGLHHGAVHAECRVNEDGVYVLEVAARPIGGLCSKALRFRASRSALSEETSLEEILLRHAIGDDVSMYAREPRASGVMMIPIPRRGIYRRVEGLEAAQDVIGVGEVKITAKPDAPILPLPEGRSYLGFIFANATEPSGVDQALREAHSRLHFVIDREVALVTP
ncbi:MAG: ATP-grasp domain-containing protein [Acidobacteria bacterium]|nr:ATP-grasp domain-containing protein [Acidobacteriota bacterium]